MSEELVEHELESQISKDSDIDDPDAPKIYTSDDDRVPSPDRKRPNPILSQRSSDDATSRDTLEESKVAKKPRLAVPPSLVSYAIDEDDDEPTAPSDEEPSNAEDSNSEKVDNAVKMVESAPDSTLDTSVSPVASGDFPFISLHEPPTILSSDHQIRNEPIHVPSQEHLRNSPVPIENLAVSDIPASQTESNEEPKKVPTTLEEVQLPPEPAGHCRMELQEKVDREVRRMRLDISYDPNRAIQDNKAFRNPSIYEKLISFLNIDEKGTNFPQEIYDPYRWTQQSYYDELARVQNREIDRLKLLREQKKPEGNQQNSTTGTANTQDTVMKSTIATGFVEPKKRSKWDTGVPESDAINTAAVSEPSKMSTALPVGGLVKQK